MPGPVPKRSEERRRRNKDGFEVEKVNLAELIAEDVEIPIAPDNWDPIARMWFESLKSSGQAIFYEPSDWMTAYLIAESISRDLGEQVVGFTPTGEVLRDVIPMKGASLNAYLKGMSALMVTEGDRRKLRIELERAKAKAAIEDTGSNVVGITQNRADLFK